MSRRFRRVLPLCVVLAVPLSGCTGILVTARKPAPPEQQVSQAKVLAAEEVTLSAEALRLGQLRVEALGQTLELSGVADFGTAPQHYKWRGRVSGDELSHAAFATRKGAVYGFVRTSAGLILEVVNAGPGKHVIRQLDGQTFTPETPPPSAPLGPAVITSALGNTCTVPQNDIVNVAVYYTEEARDLLGGDDGALAAIDASILSSNQVYVDSQVRVRLNLVEAAPVTYSQSNANTALSQLSAPNDGVLDELHARRSVVGADVVVLVIPTGTCGVAWQLRSTTNPSFGGPFAVVHPSCFVNLGMVHEVGHILGAHHDVDNVAAGETIAFPWAHGWVDLSRRLVSVMAYGTRCRTADIPCMAAGRFSNPRQSFGDAQTADNSRVLNDTARIVSSYVCSPSNPITLGSRLVDSTIKAIDDFGNYWYLDGREQPAEVTFENTGDTPWDSSFALTLVEPENNLLPNGSPLLDIGRVPLAPGEVINPGQQKKFTFSFIGNAQVPLFQWQMTDGSGKPFGDRTARVRLMPKGN